MLAGYIGIIYLQDQDREKIRIERKIELTHELLTTHNLTTHEPDWRCETLTYPQVEFLKA